MNYSWSDSDRGIYQNSICKERICCLQRKVADLTFGAYAGRDIKVCGRCRKHLFGTEDGYGSDED